MCGIFGVISQQNNAAETVLNGLKKLEYRGYDSWGITVKQNGQLVRERHVGKIGSAKTKLPKSTLGLGHTRWATHGGVTVNNAHPHLDCSKKISLVHNGIVENFLDLKQTLVKKHQFDSETDTEVALHLIEELSKKTNLKSATLKAFKKIRGMNAFIIINADENELIAVKNGSPLAIGIKQNALFISSDVWALLDHTNQIVFMEDNQLAHLSLKGLKLFSTKTNRLVKPKINTLNWQSEQSRLGKFHCYMEKEIFDQPRILDNLSRLEPKTLEPIIKAIKKSKISYLLGCGTAYYAALFGEYLFNLSGQESASIVGSEFKKNQHLLSSDKSFLMLSQSGETIDVIEATDLAIKNKMKIFSLTNVLGSTLYRKSNFSILLQAGQEVAVASTKAFTSKLAILIQLDYLLRNKLKIGQALVSQSAKAVAKVISGQTRKQIKDLARTIKDQNHVLVIGRGLSYPIALETALKIKEVSYIHAEGYAGGELKHGPIALIDQGTPCIVIAPNDYNYQDIISAAHEMKARGGFIIGISPKKDKVFDLFIKVEDLKEATAIPITAVAQTLAYDLTIVRGLNPDKPRNLAKSVTVK